MDFMNKIELQGCISNVRLKKVGETLICCFNLSTYTTYSSRDGEIMERTTVEVLAWYSPGMPDFTKLTNESLVHVTGRLRIRSMFNGEIRDDPQIVEVIATNIELVKPKRTI